MDEFTKKYLINENMETVAIELIAMNVFKGLVTSLKDDDWLKDIKDDTKLFNEIIIKGTRMGTTNFFKVAKRM